MQATMKLNQFQKLMLSPVRADEEQKNVTQDIKLLNLNNIASLKKQAEEDEYYDEEYDDEEGSPQKNINFKTINSNRQKASHRLMAKIES